MAVSNITLCHSVYKIMCHQAIKVYSTPPTPVNLSSLTNRSSNALEAAVPSPQPGGSMPDESVTFHEEDEEETGKS